MSSKTETGTATASAAASSNKVWRNSIIALVVVFVLAIVGIVYCGTVEIPKQEKTRDVAACKTFEAGYQNAKLEFIAEMIQKEHTPDPLTAIQNYMDKLFPGSIRAAKDMPYESKLGKAMIDLNVSKLSYDGSSAETANQSFRAYDAQAINIQNICYGLGVKPQAPTGK
jgi:hypothetical protein